MRITNKILRGIELDEKTPDNYVFIRKIYLLRFLIFIGIAIFLFIVIRNAFLGLLGVSILNLISLGVLVFLNFKLNNRKLVDFISYFSAIYILLHLLLLNIIDYNNPLSVTWAYLYPLIVYFLLGVKPGVILSVILMILIYLLNSIFGFKNIIFNYITYFEYFSTYIAIIVITHIIEFLNLKILKLFKYSHNELIHKNDELTTAYNLIEELESKHRNMIDMANDAILLIENGGIIYANKKVFEILDTNEKDIIGKNFLEIVHPSERKRIEQIHLQRLKSDLEIQPYETILQKNDGTELNVEVNGSILEQNGRKSVMVILRDITLRKIQQEEREVLISELEETRKKLLKEKEGLMIMNDKLCESEQNLKDSLNLKDKFLQIMSHDLINPVSGSKHLISLLYDDYKNLKDDEIQEILSALKSTAINLDEMLQTLILWAKSQSNMIKPNPIKFDINELMESITSLLSSQALKKQISIIKDTSKEVEVFADLNMVHTILRNLISNAIKFTYENGQINIGVKELNDEFVEIYVKDNGIGMNEKALKNLFDIKNKFTTQGTNSERGHGLGLLLVKDFVELNGGTISVESQLNKGSCFKFTLPKADGK